MNRRNFQAPKLFLVVYLGPVLEFCVNTKTNFVSSLQFPSIKDVFLSALSKAAMASDRHQPTISVVFLLFIQLAAGTAGNVSCVRRCGPNHVPYPFGFTSSCEIPLSCQEGTGEFHLGGGLGFRVRNITADSVLVDFPADCRRKISSMAELFAPNFAPTRQNELLLLGNCSAKGGCVTQEALQEERLGPRDCRRKFQAGALGNLSCYPRSSGEDHFLRLADVEGLDCKYLFSSMVVADRAGPTVSLEIGAVELGWWIPGRCRCSQRASCKEVFMPSDGREGFRCRCGEGYEGDGFQDGFGCRKVSTKCNPSKYMSGSCGGTTRVGVLVGGIIAGATIMAALAIICYFVRRRSTSLRNRRSTKRLLSEAAGICTVPLYLYREIERATNGFSEKQRLGTGAYGTVYAGKLHSDGWVAIKKIKHRDTDGIEQVMNEIKLLSSVSHPNLVRLLGCCIERGEQILVYEFMPNGTLSQHLQRERGRGLPWMVRLTIAVDTAKAIAYLHSAMNPPIFHRDIKSSNILLDFNYNTKVADFGLSRFGMTESSHISTAPQGTPGYLDPQYHQNFHLSDKSDVYSFGVVLVEIISALKVVDFNRVQSEVNLAALAIDRIGKGCVEEIIDPFLEPHRDAWTLSSVHKVAELAFRCLAFHRDMRPSMVEVAAELEYLRQSAWPQMDNFGIASSTSSFSSESDGSESSLRTIKKTEVDTRKLMIPKPVELMVSVEERVDSPVSVQDPWISEQSSPSTNSLLGNVVR